MYYLGPARHIGANVPQGGKHPLRFDCRSAFGQARDYSPRLSLDGRWRCIYVNDIIYTEVFSSLTARPDKQTGRILCVIIIPQSLVLYIVLLFV